MARRCAWLLLALLLLSGQALADWTAEDANVERYTQQYGAASEQYKRIRFNAEGERIVEIKEALASLGYFPYRISDNYYRTLEVAVRVFAGQMRIGGDGSEITPLMQAMLADSAAMPKAVSPLIDVSAYAWESSGNHNTWYTYARLTRSSVLTDTQVGFVGTVALCAVDGGQYRYVIVMEKDTEKAIYVTYQPLPRTTVFQEGDSVIVFGTTRGEDSFAQAGMSKTALHVQADRIGYAK